MISFCILENKNLLLVSGIRLNSKQLILILHSVHRIRSLLLLLHFHTSLLNSSAVWRSQKEKKREVSVTRLRAWRQTVPAGTQWQIKLRLWEIGGHFSSSVNEAASVSSYPMWATDVPAFSSASFFFSSSFVVCFFPGRWQNLPLPFSHLHLSEECFRQGWGAFVK